MSTFSSPNARVYRKNLLFVSAVCWMDAHPEEAELLRLREEATTLLKARDLTGSP